MVQFQRRTNKVFTVDTCIFPCWNPNTPSSPLQSTYPDSNWLPLSSFAFCDNLPWLFVRQWLCWSSASFKNVKSCYGLTAWKVVLRRSKCKFQVLVELHHVPKLLLMLFANISFDISGIVPEWFHQIFLEFAGQPMGGLVVLIRLYTRSVWCFSAVDLCWGGYVIRQSYCWLRRYCILYWIHRFCSMSHWHPLETTLYLYCELLFFWHSSISRAKRFGSTFGQFVSTIGPTRQL